VSRDHEYLVSRGWRHTGTKRMGYKSIKYWTHPLYPPPPCGSFYQTDALELQRGIDRLEDQRGTEAACSLALA
jgi:hypothetical protein